MWFRVKGIDNEGKLVSRKIDADSETMAISLSGFSTARLESVKPDMFAAFLYEAQYPTPTLRDQALFLSSLSSLVISGQNIQEGVQRLLAINTQFKVDKAALDQAITVSSILTALRFSPMAITLAEVGEQSGQLGESLSKSADTLIRDEEIKAEMGKGVISGFVMIGIGFLIFIVAPLMFGPLLEGIMAEENVTIRTGIWSEILVGLKVFYISYWQLAIGMIAIVGAFHKIIWKYMVRVPGFRVFLELQLLVRSLRFVMAYLPLYQAGIVLDKALVMLVRQEKGDNEKILKEMMVSVSQGQTLSHVIDTDEWSGILRTGFSGFEKLEVTARVTVLENMISVLRLQQGVFSNRVGVAMKTIGMLVALVAILSIVFGFMIPMQSLKPT